MDRELQEFFAKFAALVATVEPMLTVDACIDRLNKRTAK